MAEQITLTTPITPPSIVSYSPGSLFLQLVPTPRIVVTIIGTDGVGQVFEYPRPTDTAADVTTLITALNTANLTIRSLWRRVFDRLVVDFPTRFSGGATVV